MMVKGVLEGTGGLQPTVSSVVSQPCQSLQLLSVFKGPSSVPGAAGNLELMSLQRQAVENLG